MPKAISFGRTSSAGKKAFEITSFAGTDLSSAPADIDKKRSPDAPNMMPDSRGNPIKRTGFALYGRYGERINGAFVFGEQLVIHSGTALYLDGKRIWDGMKDGFSSGRIIGGKLYIFDGKEPLVFDGEEAWPLCEEAYIPTVLISKNADECEKEIMLKGDGMSTEFAFEEKIKEIISVKIDGASTEYGFDGERMIFESAPAENAEILVAAVIENEPGGSIKEEFNLISDRWKESFICETGTEKIFTLSKKGLSKGKIKAWVLGGDGTWNLKTEGTDFTADREEGRISFSSPIGKTPVAGEDNLIIEAAKFFDEQAERINLCNLSTAFDFGGKAERIFLCGNPDEPEKDFWCAAGDPSYWPDTYYSVLCPKGSRIIGYAPMGDMLGTFISDPIDGKSVVLRLPELDESGNAFFPIKKHLQGEAAVSSRSFVFTESEQLFLTKRGVYAIAAKDVSGEKYTENRSYFINRRLCEENLADACCTKWKQFYVISAGGKLWLLDTSQRSYQYGEPLSSFQYECYLWTGIDARVLWEMDGRLFFGDSEGRICFFMSDISSAASYEDYSDEGGKAIYACWTVPDFAGDNFWRNKTIRTAALELAPYAQNKVRLEIRRNGFWEKVREWTGKISYFSWNAISWSNFSWSGNARPRTLVFRTKIKKFDKAGFRIVCDEKNRAFGLYGFSAEYSEGGKFRG